MKFFVDQQVNNLSTRFIFTGGWDFDWQPRERKFFAVGQHCATTVARGRQKMQIENKVFWDVVEFGSK